MTKNNQTQPIAVADAKAQPTKHQLIVDLLSRPSGASIAEMSEAANWLQHSTRAFMSGLKKKGHLIESDKVDGVRLYHIVSMADE